MSWWLWLLIGYFSANAIITFWTSRCLEKRYWLVVKLAPFFGVLMLIGGLINWAYEEIKWRIKWARKSK
jgi:hypothetical protein